MRHSVKLAVVMLCVVIIGGCATYDGTMALKGQGESEVESAAVVGETTKTEVQEKYGEPSSTDVSGNIWTYSLDVSPNTTMLYVPFSSYFTPEHGRKNATFEFNDNDVVTDVSFEKITY